MFNLKRKGIGHRNHSKDGQKGLQKGVISSADAVLYSPTLHMILNKV